MKLLAPQSTRLPIQVVKMPEPIEKVLPPVYPYLPEDLWLHIASFLSTEEWIGASGTCKALRVMPVERISIAVDLFKGSAAKSVLLWMASHLRGARTIVVNGWPVRCSVSKMDFNAIWCAMQPAVEASAPPLSLLTVLSLRCGRPFGVEGNHKMKNPYDGIYLSRILKKAINLGRLNIVCNDVPALPPMANLKHLSLRVEDNYLSVKRVNQFLLSMPSLETLQLCRRQHTRKLQQDALVVPAWVQHLELDNVYPHLLKLKSSDTRVTLCGAFHGLKSAFERWSDVSGQIKGVRISNIEKLYMYKSAHGSELWDNIEVLPSWNIRKMPI
ncbi:hypothetical protein COCOBI_10-0250 [Coccomyxa sp. Obi]|nr:hypothetical protein COCOBI_10-0250 [Coccomyxa sp. Obi]